MLLRKSWDKIGKNGKNVMSDSNNSQCGCKKLGKKEIIILSLVIWIVLTFSLASTTWESVGTNESCLFGRTVLGKACIKKYSGDSNDHEEHLSSEVSILVKSHLVWKGIIASYPSKLRTVWNDIIPNSDVKSAKKRGATKVFHRQFRSENKEDKSNHEGIGLGDARRESIHGILMQTRLVDSLIDEKYSGSSHPLAWCIREEIGSIPIPSPDTFSSKDDSASLVIFSTIPGFDIASEMSYFSIYRAFDSLLSHIYDLRGQYPHSIILWLPSVQYFSLEDDLLLIFHHLMTKYILIDSGVVVVPPVSFGTAVETQRQQCEDLLLGLDQQLAFLFKKFALSDTRNDYSTLSWKGESWQIQFIADSVNSVYTNDSRSTNNVVNLDKRCRRYVISRKYDSVCMPPPEHRYPLLVTGLGGSGSHFIANQLQDMGYRFRHEGIDSDGSVSWFYSVNDVVMNLEYPFGKLKASERSFLNPRFDHVIHVVRNPLDQISSFTAHTNKTYNFVLSTMEQTSSPEIARHFQEARTTQHGCFRGGMCHLRFATLTWIYWNSMIAEYADKTFHIEDVGHLLEELCTIMWPEYEDIKTRKRCPDERRMFLTRSWWSTVEYYFSKQFFPSYKSHKTHFHFKYSDIRQLDEDLADNLLRTAKRFDYNGEFV